MSQIYEQPNREPERLLTLFDKSGNDPQKCHKKNRYMYTAVQKCDLTWTRDNMTVSTSVGDSGPDFVYYESIK